MYHTCTAMHTSYLVVAMVASNGHSVFTTPPLLLEMLVYSRKDTTTMDVY